MPRSPRRILGVPEATGSQPVWLGVAYSDHDGDDFNCVGEEGIGFRAGGHSTASEGVDPKLQF